MAFLFLILQPAYASSLGVQNGKVFGYSYIAVACLLLFILGIMNIEKSNRKGLPMSIFHFVLLTQILRYTALFSFETSDFYRAVWYYFNQIQFPSAEFSCSDGGMPWSALGFNSANFICNSFIELVEIGALALLWAAVQLACQKSKGKRQIEFWVLIAYCSATDLSITAFIQIYSIPANSTFDVIGLIVAAVYLAGLTTLLGFQGYFLYKAKYDSRILTLIIEEFTENQAYFHYFYYPGLLISSILYVFLIVFTQSRPYTPPIVLSIVNLILFSYIVSIRPFLYLRSMISSFIFIFVEIIYLYLPIMYSVNTIPDNLLDILSIVVFAIGSLSIMIQAYNNSKAESSIAPLNDSRLEISQGGHGKNEILDSSIDIMEKPSNRKANHGLFQTVKADPMKNEEMNNESILDDRNGNNNSGLKHDHATESSKQGLKSPLGETPVFRFAEENVYKEAKPRQHYFDSRKPPIAAKPNSNADYIKPGAFLHRDNYEKHDEEYENAGRANERGLGISARPGGIKSQLKIPNFEDIDNINSEMERKNKNVDPAPTPASYLSSGKTANLNTFTVKSRLDFN